MLVLCFGPGLYSQIRLAWQQRVVDRRLRDVQVEHARLLAERERLESDPVYVEGLIRSTFKVAKPGELVVPLDDGKSTTTNSTTAR